MKTPWKAFHHRMKNLYPSNPTQTNYLRFQKNPGALPPSWFDKKMSDMEKSRKEVFRTPYLDMIRDEGEQE